MQETIIPAAQGWYLVTPVHAAGEPPGIARMPIVAWRIADGARPQPVALDGSAGGSRGASAILGPDGTVHHGSHAYRSAAEYLAALGRQGGEPAPQPAARGRQPAGATPSARLLDPELAEEDRAHAPLQLVSEDGAEFTLHAHEWQKLLALAREHGWVPAGTRHDSVAAWNGG